MPFNDRLNGILSQKATVDSVNVGSVPKFCVQAQGITASFVPARFDTCFACFNEELTKGTDKNWASDTVATCGIPLTKDVNTTNISLNECCGNVCFFSEANDFVCLSCLQKLILGVFVQDFPKVGEGIQGDPTGP